MSALANEQIVSIRCDGSEAFMPWQKAIVEQLATAYQAQRLPHALLLLGPQFVGKTVFAREFARMLLCSAPQDDQACGQCKSCLLCAAGTHPDWLNVQPETPRKILKVDTIRFVQSRLQQTAQQGGKKVCVIGPAEQMNENAANALLKILEEPPSDTYFILISHHAGKILPTILSRCQRVSFVVPPQEQLAQWLGSSHSAAEVEAAMAQGRGLPGRAYDLLNNEQASGLDRSSIESVFESLLANKKTAQELAGSFETEQLPEVLDSFMRLINGCIKSKQSDVGSNRPNALDRLSQAALQKLYAHLTTAKRVLDHNANPRLLMESLLLQCVVIYHEFNS